MTHLRDEDLAFYANDGARTQLERQLAREVLQRRRDARRLQPPSFRGPMVASAIAVVLSVVGIVLGVL